MISGKMIKKGGKSGKMIKLKYMENKNIYLELKKVANFATNFIKCHQFCHLDTRLKMCALYLLVAKVAFFFNPFKIFNKIHKIKEYINIYRGIGKLATFATLPLISNF